MVSGHSGLWRMSVILVLRKLRQEDCCEPAGLHSELEATLGQGVRTYAKKKRKTLKKKALKKSFFTSMSDESSTEHPTRQSALFV